MTTQIRESDINIISEGTRLEGKISFDLVTRVHGILVGEVHSKPGSELILGETSTVEGSISADRLLVDGYVKGQIVAQGIVVISGTGRVVGDITTPKLELQPGAYFEGRCSMESKR